VEDVRLRRTVIATTSPRIVRVDVTDLVRLWLTHDPARASDQSISIVAENQTSTGVTFALGSARPPDLIELTRGETGQVDWPQPPRLEIYVR
jgi:hypothetical protein